MWRILFLSLLCSLFLSGCVPNNNTNVPVFEVNPYERLPQNGIHRVLPQETLYSIAWRYGFDYRMLAQWNHIQPPYHIHAGQIIVLKSRQSLPKKTIVLP